MRNALVAIIVISLLLSLGGNVLAVEKKGKKSPAKVTVTTEKQVPARKAPAEQNKTVKVDQKKYDDFIDKNNNGIDDRKEKLVPKAARKDKKKKEPQKK
ncbi:MAG: hypothetical protein KAU35_08055 [candidate division Zixibacteria bacterium]|nr:hypothetical protein [candidate division Zixibacteria bacterium]